MSHIHVCLVSEQTVPNILSVYHFKPNEILFITTSKMKKLNKTAHILDTLSQVGLSLKSHEVEVKEDSILDCKRKLDEWVVGKEGAHFSVNLTGGTKIMSIAAYEFFKDFNSEMIYIPVGENAFLTIFSKFSKKAEDEKTPLSLRLNVTNYLAAYGLKVTNQKKLTSNQNDALQRKELSEWIVTNYEDTKPFLEYFSENLREHRDKSARYNFETEYIPKHNAEKELFKLAGFEYKNATYSKQLTQSEIIYLTGGWLEEYCYNEIVKFHKKGIDDVVLGIIPEAKGRKNEFDVMFTKDNALYTVECKSLDQNDDKKTEALYKIGALQKDFGLQVKSFFVSTSPHILSKDGEIRQSVAARAEQFRTDVITHHKVKDFGKVIAKKLNLNTKE